MISKGDFSSARGREFPAVHDGFSASWVAEAQDFPLQRQKFPSRPRFREPAVEIFGVWENPRRERARRRVAGESKRRAL